MKRRREPGCYQSPSHLSIDHAGRPHCAVRHAGLKCHTSLLGCVLRAAEVAEEMGCYRQGLNLLNMSLAALLPGLDKDTLDSVISFSGLQAEDQAGVEGNMGDRLDAM